jgi:hypothetical protein
MRIILAIPLPWPYQTPVDQSPQSVTIVLSGTLWLLIVNSLFWAFNISQLAKTSALTNTINHTQTLQPITAICCHCPHCHAEAAAETAHCAKQVLGPSTSAKKSAITNTILPLQ